jgi:capsular polysaccharide transport system permease protein
VSSNEERIARWRARREAEAAAREAHADLPPSLAVIAAGAETLATAAPEDTGALLSALVTGLRALPSQSNADRRAIYDALAQGLERGGGAAGINPELAELRRRQLRMMVRMVEGDLRDGIDVRAEGYRPAAIEEAMHPLTTSYQRLLQRREAQETQAARRQAVLADEAYSVALEPEDESDIALLRAALDRIDATRGPRRRADEGPGPRSIAALLRYEVRLLMGESRVALAWTLLGPAALLTLISLLYLVVGTHHVLDMDVQTFAMLGATTWIMFRQIIFRTSTAFYAHRALLNLRPFTATTIGLTEGMIHFLTYLGVFVLLITGGWITGFFSPPAHLLQPAAWVSGMAAAAAAMGVIFGSIAVIWPYFLRFAPVIERGLQLFSGVFFVSEQLPDQYRPYLLWCPFAHALQKIRSSYFDSYVSLDADGEYFLVWLGVLVLVAAVMQRAVRARSQPM